MKGLMVPTSREGREMGYRDLAIWFIRGGGFTDACNIAKKNERTRGNQAVSGSKVRACHEPIPFCPLRTTEKEGARRKGGKMGGRG